MNVLFICNGNVARSQEAEAYFNAMADNSKFHSLSAGINVTVGKPLDPLVMQVMEEEGISLAQAKRKLLTPEMVKQASCIISFKPTDELPEYARTATLHYWEVADPQYQSIEFHRLTRNKIKALVSQLVTDLTK